MLLTEYRQFKVDKLLVEQSIKENKSLVVKGVIQRAEAKIKMEEFNQEKFLKEKFKNMLMVLLKKEEH